MRLCRARAVRWEARNWEVLSMSRWIVISALSCLRRFRFVLAVILPSSVSSHLGRPLCRQLKLQVPNSERDVHSQRVGSIEAVHTRHRHLVRTPVLLQVLLRTNNPT